MRIDIYPNHQVVMNQITHVAMKKILAGEPQNLINLKLQYNNLASIFNAQGEKLSSKDKKHLLRSLERLDKSLYMPRLY